MERDRDTHMADVLAFKCAHAVLADESEWNHRT